MTNFDYDKIRDMEYNPERGRYIGEDGSELRVTPYADGTGYKYDYYEIAPIIVEQINSLNDNVKIMPKF